MSDPSAETPLQPFLHDGLVTLRAPGQAWSRSDGRMGSGAIDGVYVSDVRVLDRFELVVGGGHGEHVSTETLDASTVIVTSLHRGLDAPGADPDVRGELRRTTRAGGTELRFTLTSRRDTELRVPVAARLRAAIDSMDRVRTGLADAPVTVTVETEGASWSRDAVDARLRAPGAAVAVDGSEIVAAWHLVVPARGSAGIVLSVDAEDAAAVVAAPAARAGWSEPELTGADDRLRRWTRRALDDLDALRVVRPGAADQFLAAGAPWFFTLFGRDSLWAARLLLPIDAGLAASTLRTLAGLQGRERVAETAEQPGKIVHEVRRAELHGGDGVMVLPPLYYGTVDATPLWVALLVDGWRSGRIGLDEARALRPHLEAALNWMRDFGDSDGDGLLEYVDETGHGLSNQGWKDSGDSVQWRDGTLAAGPIALVEVQGYAYEAATGGADLLAALGAEAEAVAAWREWAERLRSAVRERFWVDDPGGAYPAIALDAEKRPVDTLTSNIGHLLGTGILSPEESALVAARLVSPELSSGFGLRTLSTDAAGYWPLSYHGGTVWAHDTAIAIRGLARDGFRTEAAHLAEGLLAAAAAFGYRMPELHAGDAAADYPAPAPYPAACRPQAWSAAAAITVGDALR